MAPCLSRSVAEKKRPLPGTGTYEKLCPSCPDKLLRKKGPCQELERTRNGALFVQLSCREKKKTRQYLAMGREIKVDKDFCRQLDKDFRKVILADLAPR